MPQARLFNLQGDEVAQVELSGEMFDVEPNLDLIHQALVYVDSQRAQSRGHTLTRSEISLTSAKFSRQKGLGRARHGARSAPLFVGGAKAHSPRGVQRKLRMPKKMRRKALAGVLTAQYRKGLLRFVDDLRPEKMNTRQMATALADLRCSRGRTLAIVSAEEYYDENLDLSTRNLPRFILRCAPHFNVRDVLAADHIIITQGALAELTPGGESDANN